MLINNGNARIIIKSVLILFSAFLSLEYATIPALAIPRLAVIAEKEDARPASDILTAQLSQTKDYAVLERDEIARLFCEQQIVLEGFAEQIDLSRLTGADGLILLQPIDSGGQRLLVARIVAVHPGVVLDTLSCPLPCADYEALASLTSRRVKQLLPKFEVLARDAIPISILNIRAEYETERTKSLEHSLKKLLFTRLLQEPSVFVLERQSLDKLDWEKKFSLKSEDKFWTAGYLLDGSFSEVITNRISLNVNLLAPDGACITNVTIAGNTDTGEKIIDQTARQILKALHIAPSSVLWSPKDEADRYYRESLWAYRWKLYSESISAIESSWALGNQTEEVAFQRLQCYLQSLASENDTSFVVKRLIEFYRDYRRMFPQKSLKTVAYVIKNGLRWSASSEEDVRKAHYYNEVINAALALFQKEEQNPEWGRQHHDVLMDIRSLILTVCREIDEQAEKEQITSPIKDLIITQGYYWYDNHRDYIAALYRSLEGRNDSRIKLFVAIAEHPRPQWLPEAFRWPDKILKEFKRYAPEFNSGLCHSSNSVNRLIGHYCELKWAPTNQVIIADNMEHILDDLWESRDDVLNLNTTFYIDAFNLWAEKSMALPADMKELCNERISRFHRKYLVYAINARQIPPRWFRKVFEDYLNMPLEEGLSFYNTHLTNLVSELEYVRNAFYVVYVSRKVLVDIQEKSTTNSFRIKWDSYALTRAMENRSYEERQKSHNLPTPLPPSPSTASPYQSLIVTQYYSLGDRIQNITFANGKIWVALPGRMLMLDENSFTSTEVHAIARPDMQWVGSNLFLDAGAEVVCLAPNNRLLKKWQKPNGENDFRFYVFQDDLYFFKEGLIISTDLKTSASRVIASRRRKPPQTLLDGSEFGIAHLFQSSNRLLALIGNAPKEDGIYAFDPATVTWEMTDSFPGSHKTHNCGSSFLLAKKCREDMLFFNSNLDGSDIELWSTSFPDKQLLLGLNYGLYKSKWAIPEALVLGQDRNNTTDALGKMAEYDGNNLYLFTAPKYDDYHILLWFFDKDRETGMPVQIVFRANDTNIPPGLTGPIASGLVTKHWQVPMGVAYIPHASQCILTGYSRGLIMASKNATGFWFLPIEEIRAHMIPKLVLSQPSSNFHNASRVPSEPVPLTNGTSASDCGPVPGQPYAVDLGVGVKLEMVWIPPGEFMMGSPLSETGRHADETQHKVVITKGFWMGKYEVTQEQWQRVMKNNPSQIIGTNLPVDSVTWHECQKFCSKLDALISRHNSTINYLRFFFSTEAEWEYACRAGTTTRFYAGDSTSDLDRAGWYSGNSGGTTHPVGQKQPNAWGLYDMHGNIMEWCADWYGGYEPVAVRDPRGMNSGNARILRSSWRSFPPEDCRSATRRFRADPGAVSSAYGFRIVLYP